MKQNLYILLACTVLFSCTPERLPSPWQLGSIIRNLFLYNSRILFIFIARWAHIDPFVDRYPCAGRLQVRTGEEKRKDQAGM